MTVSSANFLKQNLIEARARVKYGSFPFNIRMRGNDAEVKSRSC
jgi:hypothetical protein